ncbi:MAG: DUF4288 domain-containing protein [Verrucomicrobia bacterium]|jgi:hypothetical protein|nr:DUF4288 domain-containing protein [Verrucomicrobiota bacterium]
MDDSSSWYGVRTLYRIEPDGDNFPQTAHEERICLVRAVSFDEAIEKGASLEERYAAEVKHATGVGEIVAFHIHGGTLEDGEKVWSCIRVLGMSDSEFEQHIFKGHHDNYVSLRSSDLSSD